MNPIERLMFRVITDKRCSETWESIDNQGIGYLLKIIEQLDIMDYIERVNSRIQKEQMEKQK